MANVNNDNNNVIRNSSDHLALDVVESRAEHTGRAGAVTTAGDGVVSTGAWDVTTAQAGAVTTARAGSMAVNTAGAGSVSVSGGTGGGGVNTSGAGSVHTYTGVSAAKGNDVEEEDCASKLPWMVGVLGGLADGAAAAAALYKSPLGVAAHCGELAYRVGLASVLVAGVVEIAAAFWVCGDTQKRRDTGEKILYVSICTLLLAIALVGAAIVLKK